MSQLCVLAEKKGNSFLECINRSTASTLRVARISLCSVFIGLHPEYYSQFGDLQYRKYVGKLEWVLDLSSMEMASGQVNSSSIPMLRLPGRWSQPLNGGTWQEDERQWAVETWKVQTGHQGRLFTMRAPRHWKKLPREFVQSPSLQNSRLNWVSSSDILWLGARECLRPLPTWIILWSYKASPKQNILIFS